MSDKNNDFIFAKSPKKLCFGAIFTIAGRFFQEETFPKDLGFVTQNCIKSRNTMATFRKKICQFREKLRVDGFLATGGGPKKKKKTLSSVVKDSA